MIFRLTIPELTMGAEQARVAIWHKQPGDEIAFGDTVCELKVREWKTVGRTKNALRLTRRRDQGKPDAASPAEYSTMVCKTCRERPDLEGTGDCPSCLVYRIIASEPGTLESQEVEIGVDMPVGGLIALVRTPHEPAGGVDVQPIMRVVADLVDRAGQEA